MQASPVSKAAVIGVFRGKGAQSANEMKNHAKGSLSVAALFAIVAGDAKLKMVKPR